MTDPGDTTGRDSGLLDRAERHIFRRLRNYFITGLVVTAPILITLYLVWIFIGFVDGMIVALLPEKILPQTYLPFDIPGLGLLIVIAALIFVGAFAANFLGRWVVRTGDSFVDRMPVIRSVYGTLKKIFSTVLDQSSRSFREVVLVEYPRKGIWAIGFVTGTTEGEIQGAITDDVVNVFVPTTPNPTSGYLVFLPRKDLISLSMSVDEGIKMVISGGIMTPPDGRQAAVEELPNIRTGTGAE